MDARLRNLYEPLIVRDLHAIPEAVRRDRDDHGEVETLDAILRFTILAHRTAQHSRHAMIAAMTAREILSRIRDTERLLVECAIYAAESRPPWTEPPLAEPPSADADPPATLEELRSALRSEDRPVLEQWLVTRMDHPDFPREFFAIATDDFADLGHRLIVSLTAWKAAAVFPPQARYSVLSVALSEWLVRAEPETEGAEERSTDLDDLARSLVVTMVESGGDLVAFHHLALLDAAMQAEQIVANPLPLQRALGHLSSVTRPENSSVAGSDELPPLEDLLIYRYARDYAACLQSVPIEERLRQRIPGVDFQPMVLAARENRERSSFEEWSFA